MNIPGEIIKHMVVSKQCRIKPELVIKRETVDELWETYLRILKTLGDDTDIKIHFAITTEKPND